MRISALEEYGLRCMILLAEAESAMSITEIAESEKISAPYVGKLMRILREADLVHAERGRNGGYSLNGKASKISLESILNALSEPIYGDHHCEKYSNEENSNTCVHYGNCKIGNLWNSIYKIFSRVVSHIYLEDLVKGDKANLAELVEIAVAKDMVKEMTE